MEDRRPLNMDDVLDMHRFLRDFDGNLQEIVNIQGRKGMATVEVRQELFDELVKESGQSPKGCPFSVALLVECAVIDFLIERAAEKGEDTDELYRKIADPEMIEWMDSLYGSPMGRG